MRSRKKFSTNSTDSNLVNGGGAFASCIGLPSASNIKIIRHTPQHRSTAASTSRGAARGQPDAIVCSTLDAATRCPTSCIANHGATNSVDDLLFNRDDYRANHSRDVQPRRVNCAAHDDQPLRLVDSYTELQQAIEEPEAFLSQLASATVGPAAKRMLVARLRPKACGPSGPIAYTCRPTREDVNTRNSQTHPDRELGGEQRIVHSDLLH